MYLHVDNLTSLLVSNQAFFYSFLLIGHVPRRRFITVLSKFIFTLSHNDPNFVLISPHVIESNSDGAPLKPLTCWQQWLVCSVVHLEFQYFQLFGHHLLHTLLCLDLSIAPTADSFGWPFLLLRRGAPGTQPPVVTIELPIQYMFLSFP